MVFHQKKIETIVEKTLSDTLDSEQVLGNFAKIIDRCLNCQNGF